MRNILTENELHKYLTEKNVPIILSEIVEELCLERPDDVIPFIISNLQKKLLQQMGSNNNNINNNNSITSTTIMTKKPQQPIQQSQNQTNKKSNNPIATSMTTTTTNLEADPQFAATLQKYSWGSNTTPANNLEVAEKQDDDDEDDWKDERAHEIDEKKAEAIRRKYSTTHSRRDAFSAESVQVQDLDNFERVVYPKTDEEQNSLKVALTNNVLFNHLESDDLKIIFDAMFEKKCKAGDVIIRQGDEGDNFYVVDQGICSVYVSKNNQPSEKVTTIIAGGTFGELALIYGKPRAATVKAETDVRLWAIGRETYRKILLKQTQEKRKKYDDFLKRVPLLESLTDYERLTVADALQAVNYNDKEVIVRQGEPGYACFFIVEGNVIVTQETPQHQVIELSNLGAGSIFGEMALLRNQGRAASVTAKGPVKCVKLDRKSFNRVLGPCEDILRRNLEQYNQIMTNN